MLVNNNASNNVFSLMPARQPASVAAVYDRRMENKLGAQRRKITVEALCERL